MSTPLEQILDLAQNALDNADAGAISDAVRRAEIAIDDATHLVIDECPISAASRALDSLSYSVGREHADYVEARRLFGEVVGR